MNQLNRLIPDRAISAAADLTQDEDIQIKPILRSLWRGRYWILLTTLLGFAFGYYRAEIVATPVYLATTTIMLESEETAVAGLPSLTASNKLFNDGMLTTEVGVIKSYNLVEQLVRDLGLVNDPAFNPYLSEDPANAAGDDSGVVPSEDEIIRRIVGQIRSRISVTNPQFSFMLEISVSDTDRARAALFANALADLYIRDQIRVRFERTREAKDWLSEQTAALKSDLEVSARRIERFRAEADLQNEESLEALNFQLKSLRERTEQAESEAGALLAQKATLEAAMASGSPQQVIAALEQTGGRALGLTTEEAAIATMQDIEPTYVAAIGGLERRLQRQQLQADSLRESLDRQQATIDRQSAEYVELRQLEREVDADRLIYEYFLARLKEAAVKEGFAQASARVLSPAFGGTQISPHSGRIIGMATLFGLLIGCGLIALRERMNDSFRLGDELENETGLPVLGQIPRIPGRSRADLISYIVGKPGSVAAEAVRGLRTSLQHTSIDAPPRVIVLTSSVPGEGKTVTSVALAHHFAGLGKAVLLIEGDVRRRAFEEIFPGPDEKSLLNVLSGETGLLEAVQSHTSLGIDILSSGSTEANPADILASHAFSCLIDVAREAYDIILIDTPPLLLVPDARVLGQYADTILFMVQWDSTRRDQVQDALAQLRLAGRSPDGVVLTQIDTDKMRAYGHGRRYGAYRAKGAGKYYAN